MEATIRTARKDHKCTLCFQTIPKGSEYKYAPVRPWDHPDNEGFSSFKAHLECNKLWAIVGDSCDWSFPLDGAEWQSMTEGMTGKEKP